MKTAEEIFIDKIRELEPNKAVIALRHEIVNAEQAMRWAHEFKELHFAEFSSQDKWVDFKKQIPQLNISVLAVDEKDGYMEVVDVQEIEGKLCICTKDGYSLFSDAKPTHWQLLPSPPKTK